MLIADYRKYLTAMPSEVREVESVLTQLETLATLYGARGRALSRPDDKTRETALIRIRASLSR